MELPLQLMDMLPDPQASPDIGQQQPPAQYPAPSPKPLLRVEKDRRKGKTATLITGYTEDSDEVRALAKTLKQQLAVGGSTRDGDILLQGDLRHKVSELLVSLGYKVKVIQ